MAFPPKKGDPSKPPGPPGMPPAGGPAPGPGGPPLMMPPTGMPRPGQPMDPLMAMLNGMPPLVPPPAPPPAAPMGEHGMPVGGALPDTRDQDFDPTMGGSDLLMALQTSLEDPYGAGPEGHANLEGLGPQDPNMGMDQLMQLLAMAQLGVGGLQQQGPPPGMPGNMGNF